MVSIVTLIISIIAAGAIGFIAGVFVYRNNSRTMGKIADKVDMIKDTLDGYDKQIHS